MAGPARLALGLAYRGGAYDGWQSQPGGRTVQDTLEAALTQFVGAQAEGLTTVRTVCAGRTDAGVHAMQQVVHIDPPVQREAASWVRGTNSFLPADIAVQWCQPVAPHFHARFGARSRRYRYVVLQSAVRPAIESGLCGWVFRPLDLAAMHTAAQMLLGTHDFSAFRAAACQSPTPIKTLHSIAISQRGAYWRFDFEANAYLHHMVRNLMGCLLAVGQGRYPAQWAAEVLASRSRKLAAPTFGAAGLYFMGPQYDAEHRIPTHVAAMDWLP